MKREDENFRPSGFDKLRGKNTEEADMNKIQQSYKDIILDIKKNPKMYKAMIITSIIIGIVVASLIVQLFLNLVGKQDKIYIVELFTAWMCPVGIIMALFFSFMAVNVQYRFHKVTEKDYYMDREGNFQISKSGVHGTAHWQTEEEREKCFKRSKNYDDLKGDILGIDDNGLLYTLRPDLVGINRNKCVFGVPGSGKSAAIIENDIMKCMERGESAIITDSKGDLYRKLSQKAIDNGYVVRVLNLKPNELKNSDAFHLLKYLDNGTTGDTAGAEMLANAIIENCGNGHMDYWGKNEMNGYKALLLYISTNQTYKACGENTLAKMFELSKKKPQELAVLFSNLDKDHPARQAYDIFAEAKEDVQGQILNGMGITLGFFTDPNAREIVSHDEIDLVLPMKRKCMYFVVIPDSNKTFNGIANLFFNMMLIKQCEYSDSLSEERKKKQLYVNYILDEFRSTGAINDFDKTITTVRSRKIAITVVLQTIGQLNDMYTETAAQAILGSMTTKVLLRAGDKDTAEYFTLLCGRQTRRVAAGRYSEHLSQSFPLHDFETKTESLVGEDLLPAADAFKMSPDVLVISILGFEPVKLNKYLSFNNPYLQDYRERIPGRHKPLWRKAKEDKEKERMKQREEVYGNNMEMQKPVMEISKPDVQKIKTASATTPEKEGNGPVVQAVGDPGAKIDRPLSSDKAAPAVRVTPVRNLDHQKEDQKHTVNNSDQSQSEADDINKTIDNSNVKSNTESNKESNKESNAESNIKSNNINNSYNETNNNDAINKNSDSNRVSRLPEKIGKFKRCN